MNLIDIVIILFIIMGAIIGFKQGALQKLTSFVGTFVIIIVAFMFKDNLSVLFYENLPFFNLWGVFKGIEILNVVLYQILAFVFIFLLLLFALRVLLVVTGLLELILKFTVILNIPSKILGIFVGAVEYYVYAFLILFVLSLPVFNITMIKESNYATKILEETPLLSEFADETVVLYGEIYNIIDNRNNKTEVQLNEEVLVFMLENDFITYDSTMKLVEKNKLHLDDTSFIEQYKEG